jgi:hypothetical protein
MGWPDVLSLKMSPALVLRALGHAASRMLNIADLAVVGCPVFPF